MRSPTDTMPELAKRHRTPALIRGPRPGVVIIGGLNNRPVVAPWENARAPELCVSGPKQYQLVINRGQRRRGKLCLRISKARLMM